MTNFDPIPAETERIASGVVHAVFQVHSTLGPGLLESVYEACLCHELKQRGIPFRAQVRYQWSTTGFDWMSGFG